MADVDDEKPADQTVKKAAKHDSVKATDLEKVTDYVEEAEILTNNISDVRNCCEVVRVSTRVLLLVYPPKDCTSFLILPQNKPFSTAECMSDIIHPCNYESVPEHSLAPLRHGPHTLREKFN